MLELFKKNKNGTVCKLVSPLSGTALSLINVPDQVFSQKIVGDGIAVEPSDGLVLSPCNGRILNIFRTNHAFVIGSEEGLEILIHLGLDTVDLNGDGFECIVNANANVKIGEPIIRMDLEKIKKMGKKVITPIVILNMDIISDIEIHEGLKIAGRDDLMTIRFKGTRH